MPRYDQQPLIPSADMDMERERLLPRDGKASIMFPIALSTCFQAAKCYQHHSPCGSRWPMTGLLDLNRWVKKPHGLHFVWEP